MTDLSVCTCLLDRILCLLNSTAGRLSKSMAESVPDITYESPVWINVRSGLSRRTVVVICLHRKMIPILRSRGDRDSEALIIARILLWCHPSVCDHRARNPLGD